MDDNPGLIILTILSSLTVLAVLASLCWAAVLDGRDERASRRRSPSR
jgi:hypothetical protein